MSSGSNPTGDHPSEEQSSESSGQPLSLSATTQSHGHILSQPNVLQHTELLKPIQKSVRSIAPAPTGIVKSSGGSHTSNIPHSSSLGGMSSGILAHTFRGSQKVTPDSSHVTNLGSNLMVGTHSIPVTLPQPGIVQMNPSSIVSSTQTVAPSVMTTSLPMNIIRAPTIQHQSTFPSHLPRGAVAASALSLTKTGPTMAAGSALLRPAQPATVQIPISTAQGIPTLLQSNRPLMSSIKPGTPPIVRSTSPAIGISMPGKHGEHIRSSYQYHGSVKPSTNPAIQITLRNAAGSDSSPNPIITHTGHSLAKSVQLSHTQPIVTQSKIIVSQSSSNPMIPTPLVKTAKITAQRSSAVSTLLPTSVTEVSRSESASHQISHTPSNLFFSASHRGNPTTSTPVTTSLSQHTPTHQTDIRHDRSNMSNLHIPFNQEPVYNMYNHTIPVSSYHTLMYQPQNNVRQPPGINFVLSRPQLDQAGRVSVSNPVPNLSATLQAHPISMASSSSVRFNPIMIDQSGRHSSITVPSYCSSSSSTSLENKTGTFLSAGLSDSGVSNLASVATVASNLYSSTTGNQQQQPVSSSSSNPSASPRPTILRKRTSDNAGSVKKNLALMTESHSPRPEASNQPQSNTSSPKTPAGENSQSSTDTALSSNDAATPTQNSLPEMRIKQEPPELENGLSILTSAMASQSSIDMLSNSVEASPRKKPRKQLLHANEELKDNTSSDEEVEKFSEIKKERISKIKEERTEYFDDEGIRWTTDRCKPNVSLLNFYNLTWKARNNHFQKVTDVKPKEERRPTVNELSNQKGILQKSSGWKLYHMAAQLEDLVDLEKELCERVSKFQQIFDPKYSTVKAEEDYNIPYEMAQANIQRCKLLVEQLKEAKSSMLKVLDHKPKIQEIVNKHMSKRPIKKKERT